MIDKDLERLLELALKNNTEDIQEYISLKSKLEEKLGFYKTYNSNEAHSSACASTVNAILQQENQKLKEENKRLDNERRGFTNDW